MVAEDGNQLRGDLDGNRPIRRGQDAVGDHDWTVLFYRTGLLGEESVALVAGTTHLLGTVVMVLGLLWWAYFVVPISYQRRLNDVITARSPALVLLFPDPRYPTLVRPSHQELLG